MDLGLSGRRAAVAASTAGLGLAVAEALAGEGCSVVISGRDPERLGRATERVPGAIPVVSDVSDAAGGGWGRILAITSITVRRPVPSLILSNTARAGATGFLKTLAGEVAADGVTVNSIQPGLHDTARLRSVWGAELPAVTQKVPARRLGDPADFGRLAALLCSEWAGYLTGAAIPVDGGLAQGLQ